MLKSTLLWKPPERLTAPPVEAWPRSRSGLIINTSEGTDSIIVTITAVHKQDPLHGITLERILTELRAEYSWEQLAEKINVRCFQDNPSIISSLKFLRRTPWARAKVERLYVKLLRKKARTAPRPRRTKKNEPGQG